MDKGRRSCKPRSFRSTSSPDDPLSRPENRAGCHQSLRRDSYPRNDRDPAARPTTPLRISLGTSHKTLNLFLTKHLGCPMSRSFFARCGIPRPYLDREVYITTDSQEIGRVPSPQHTPDFLWILLALANFMRLSLTKAAHAGVGGAPCRKSGYVGRKR